MKIRTKRDSRISKHQYFLKLAKIVATRATCPRREVGCVIINEAGHIKATGYNGVPSGYPHCTDHPCGGHKSGTGNNLESCMATHAEANALLQCDDVMDVDIIYLTVSPCINCAKLIGNTSCKMVIYSEEYINKDGINMLKKLGIITKYERIINREESQ
jgi:dCMP deaminase